MTLVADSSTIEACLDSISRKRLEAAVTGKKGVLVIGLDPALIDFSQPGYAPGMDEHAAHAKLCFNTMPSDTAEAVKRWL